MSKPLSDDDIDKLDKELKPKRRIEIPPECEEESEDFTKKDFDAVIHTNEKISNMTSYGSHEELVDKKGIKIAWSNGSKSWWIYNDKIEKGDIVELDANQTFLPISPERFNRIEACAGVLPLYFGSHEAHHRGEMCRADSLEIWAKGQLERMKRERGR